MPIQAAGNTFQEMLALAPSDSQKVIADAQYGLARVAALKPDYDEARKLAQDSLHILDAIGHRRATSIRNFLQELAGKENQHQ